MLLEHGATQDALEIAEHGLSLAVELWTLATWLRDEAATAGEADRATRAGLVALGELHSLDDYQALRTMAGDRWPTLRDKVLTELRQAAALGAGRQDDWRQYVDGLLMQHARKYSLVPQLKQLRA